MALGVHIVAGDVPIVRYVGLALEARFGLGEQGAVGAGGGLDVAGESLGQFGQPRLG